jgi:hypothetical protein
MSNKRWLTSVTPIRRFALAASLAFGMHLSVLHFCGELNAQQLMSFQSKPYQSNAERISKAIEPRYPAAAVRKHDDRMVRVYLQRDEFGVYSSTPSSDCGIELSLSCGFPFFPDMFTRIPRRSLLNHRERASQMSASSISYPKRRFKFVIRSRNSGSDSTAPRLLLRVAKRMPGNLPMHNCSGHRI